jgi:hypothetical protein
MEQLIRRTIRMVEGMKDEEMVMDATQLKRHRSEEAPSLTIVARVAWIQLSIFVGAIYGPSNVFVWPETIRRAAADAKSFLDALDKANPPGPCGGDL